MPSTKKKPATEKIDLYKLHKTEYAAPKKPKIIDVEPAQYLAIVGQGEPGSAQFEACIGGLYGMAYTIKFNSKAAGHDFVVCKLEGLYWSCDPDSDGAFDKSALEWKLMIRVPDFVTKKDLVAARQALKEKGKDGDFDAVVLERLKEGRCVQMLHVGPYDDEQVTIDAMMAFAEAKGLKPNGHHHEVYLSDPRRVPPERLRTILRQPVK